MRPTRHLVPALVAGALIGIIGVFIEVSFAALIFRGALARHLPVGVGLLLVGTVVVLVVTSVRSTLPGTIAVPQDSSAAITALMAASVAARADGATALLAVVAVMAISTLAFGAACLLLGGLRLGALVRFVPYPVVGGFLAGTGWLLVAGSIEVMGGVAPAPGALDELLAPAVLARWLPGLAFAVLLLVVLPRIRSVAAMPIAVIAAIVSFYAVAFAASTPLERLRADGWLLGPFPEGGLWRLLTPEAVRGADLSVLAGQAGSIATLVVIGLIGLLLNASGIELAVRRDLDLDAELRAAGWANVAAGAAGGLAGYQALSLTVLGRRLGGRTRLVGFTAAAVVAGTLVGGAAVLSVFPRAVLGGLLLFLGLSFLVEWVWQARTRLGRGEHAIVLLIVAVIATVGFLPGVAVGLVSAIVLFVLNYSRTSVVRHSVTAATYRSSVERPDHERRLLRERGGRARILTLQGFVFFGTANALVEQIRALLGDPEDPIEVVVLDLSRVGGMDSSAAMSFEKLMRAAHAQDVRVLLAGCSAEVRRQLARTTLDDEAFLHTFPDLDHALEHVEDLLLREVAGEARPAGEPSLLGLPGIAPYLERVELAPKEVLMRQGDPADALYFLERGRLTVLLELDGGRTTRVRRVMAGATVGELALYLGGARSSTVVADEPCVLWRMSDTALERMSAKAPKVAAAFHRFIARQTAERLADANGSLEQLTR